MKISIKEILQSTAHRPWSIPETNWKYYQEWNNVLFLHWQTDFDLLRKLVPNDLEIDLYEGHPWISIVVFSMEKIRPRNIPHFKPISNFNEVNIRTYVKYNNKAGVYFLSIEGGSFLSCKIARNLSELPYRYSKIQHTKKGCQAQNAIFKNHLSIDYKVDNKIEQKSDLDRWLTERYALFQDTATTINEFEIHHLEWSIHKALITDLDFNYSTFNHLINNEIDLVHYSKGVQVLAWQKNSRDKIDIKN